MLVICVNLILPLVAGLPSDATRTISAAEFHDRLRGMWFGQLIGNHTGRPFEGTYAAREPAPDELFAWVIKTDPNDPWTGDDDTNFEYLYLDTLENHGLSPTPAQIQLAWDAHVPLTGIYIANRQAKYLMGYGFTIPDTGSYAYNFHAYAIDAQITTESLGALSPGHRQWAINSVARFASVSNEGFSLHAAQFYGALYAAAVFEPNVPALVALGQDAIPTTSRSWQVIQDVRDWHAADVADGTPDWRATRRLIYDHYHGAYDNGRYRNWLESSINLANTVLALLYGAGDFSQTVRIAVLAGYDADCNPATAGGVLGLIHGFSGLPAELTDPVTDVYRLENRPGLPELDTITNVATRMQTVAEQVIVANGGSVAGGIYTIPSADAVTPLPERPDPNGPTGLVATVMAAGGGVSTDASVAVYKSYHDPQNLSQIIDGIIDTRHNGHVPYLTDDGDNAQPAGGDWYALHFSLPLRFDAVTYHEGHFVFPALNGDPRTGTLRGGYFEDLTVEVFRDGQWHAGTGVILSEPLDPYRMYQHITLTFDPQPGYGVRIRGTAGGAYEFTSIVELVAAGARLGDADANLDVGFGDLMLMTTALGGPAVPPRPSPPIDTPDLLHRCDAESDGDLDLIDLAWFMRAFGG